MNILQRQKGIISRLFLNVPEFTTMIMVISLFVVATIINPVFISLGNLAAISLMMVYFGFLAMGETLVVIVGEVDISIGSMTAFAMMFQGWLIVYHDFPWLAAAFLTICLTAALSFVSSLFIVKMKMAAFIVTIAMLYICRGFARMLTFSKDIPAFKSPKAEGLMAFGSAKAFGNFSWAFVILIILMVIMHIVMTRTAYGRKLYAVGDNLKAARLSGINSDWIKISAFLFSGVMVGTTSMFLLANTGTATMSTGDGWEMFVVAACAIGGISLSGGAGSMLGTILGVAFVTSMRNVLNMTAVNANWQNIIFGSIIVLAVLLDLVRRNKKFGIQS